MSHTMSHRCGGGNLAQYVEDESAIHVSPVGFLVGGGGHAVLALDPVGGVAHHRLEGQGPGQGGQQAPQEQASTPYVQCLEASCDCP